MNNKITFPRLATLLADKSGRSKRFSEDFLREFFSLISETLEAHESIKIKGLGTFRLTRVEPRRSVDVTTGEPMEISGHTKVVFIPSKELAEAINAPFEAFTAIEISDDADIDQLFNKVDIEFQNENEDLSTQQEHEVLTLETASTILVDSTETHESKEETDPQTKDETEALPLNIEISSEAVANANNEEAIENSSDFVASISDSEIEAKTNDEEVIAIKDEESKIADIDNSETETEEGSSDNQEASSSDEEDIDTNNDDDAQTETATDNSEGLEAHEEEDSGRRNWMGGFKIAFGAAVVAIFATLIIWYVFSGHDFNGIFNKTNKTAAATQVSGSVDGNKALSSDAETVESDTVSDSMADSAPYNETEEGVATAPSDALVYDTIGTMRYLTTMAKAHYGNYNLWPYIYEENKSFLGHPDRIRPGTPVVIPKLSKYGVDASKPEDIEKAKKLGVEIYARYGKKI